VHFSFFFLQIKVVNSRWVSSLPEKFCSARCAFASRSVSQWLVWLDKKKNTWPCGNMNQPLMTQGIFLLRFITTYIFVGSRTEGGRDTWRLKPHHKEKEGYSQDQQPEPGHVLNPTTQSVSVVVEFVPVAAARWLTDGPVLASSDFIRAPDF